jgi:hypothetical protein
MGEKRNHIMFWWESQKERPLGRPRDRQIVLKWIVEK